MGASGEKPRANNDWAIVLKRSPLSKMGPGDGGGGGGCVCVGEGGWVGVVVVVVCVCGGGGGGGFSVVMTHDVFVPCRGLGAPN